MQQSTRVKQVLVGRRGDCCCLGLLHHHALCPGGDTAVALVCVDDGGMAPSTAIASWHVLHNMTVTLRGTGTGTKRKVIANDDAVRMAVVHIVFSATTTRQAPESTARRPNKPRGRKYGDCPGPMPAGWVLVRRDVDDPGRQYKRYRSPDGQMFSSYGQAQQYWEGLGHTVRTWLS